MRLLTIIFSMLLFAAAPALAAERELPYREDSGLTKAEYLLSVGQYSAALKTVDDVLTRHPANADAYTYRAYAYHQLGQNADAEKNLRKALQLEPTHLGANKYLANMYLEADDMARALEQLQVMRMTCGHTDCEELRRLEYEIDQYRSGERPEPVRKQKKE